MVPLNFRGVPGLRFSQCVLLSGCQSPAVITGTHFQLKGWYREGLQVRQRIFPEFCFCFSVTLARLPFFPSLTQSLFPFELAALELVS